MLNIMPKRRKASIIIILNIVVKFIAEFEKSAKSKVEVS